MSTAVDLGVVCSLAVYPAWMLSSALQIKVKDDAVDLDYEISPNFAVAAKQKNIWAR